MYSLAFALKETTQKLSGLKQPPKNKILKNVRGSTLGSSNLVQAWLISHAMVVTWPVSQRLAGRGWLHLLSRWLVGSPQERWGWLDYMSHHPSSKLLGIQSPEQEPLLLLPCFQCAPYTLGPLTVSWIQSLPSPLRPCVLNTLKTRLSQSSASLLDSTKKRNECIEGASLWGLFRYLNPLILQYSTTVCILGHEVYLIF